MSFDDVKEQSILVLAANMDQVMTKSYLFSRVIDRLFPDGTIGIPNKFKRDFELSYRHLSLYDDNIVQFEQGYMYKSSSESVEEKEVLVASSSESMPSNKEVIEFILDENKPEELMYKDKKTGNTIYHDLVEYYDITDKLIKENRMNINILDKNGKTPLQHINSVQVSNLFLEDLYRNVEYNKQHIKHLENEIKKQSYNMYMIIILMIVMQFLPKLF